MPSGCSARIAKLDAAIEQMKDIMRLAGMAVTGGLPVNASVEAKVLWPHCLGDVRKVDDKGQAMWREVHDLIAEFQEQRHYA
jgi:hypothetical protein